MNDGLKSIFLEKKSLHSIFVVKLKKFTEQCLTFNLNCQIFIIFPIIVKLSYSIALIAKLEFLKIYIKCSKEFVCTDLGLIKDGALATDFIVPHPPSRKDVVSRLPR